MTDFNPLNHPIIYALPERLTPFSFWLEHIPFAMLLIDLLKPETVVELGSHYGDSYCAFCQAVKELGTKTKCFAVDNWVGDIHYGEYGPEVLDNLRQHHDVRYSDFSTLVQSSFDEAANNFADGSIDLLHIDGTHTYEAVKHDFITWLPKISSRGVVILHDTNVREGIFGVRVFFDEIKGNYPNFEFLHCYGLGVLATGGETPDDLEWLFRLSSDDADRIRSLFHRLGQMLSIKTKEQELLAQTQNQACIIEEKESLITAYKKTLERAEEYGNKLRKQLAEAHETAQELNDRRYQLTSSEGWLLLEKMWRIKSFLVRSARPFIPHRLLSLLRVATQARNPDLLANLDSVKVGNNQSFVADGWVFSRHNSISGLRLLVNTSSGEEYFDCKFGFPRYDVKKAHKVPQALNSGFSVAGDLTSKDIHGLSLEISYINGNVELVGLPVNRISFPGSRLAESGEAGIDDLLISLLPSAPTRIEFTTITKSSVWQKLRTEDREFLTSITYPPNPDRHFTLIFDHNVGGGANYYRSELIERVISHGKEVLLACYDLSRLDYKVEHVSGRHSPHINIASIEKLAGIDLLINIDEIFINNVYTYKAPLDVLSSILKIKKTRKASLILAAHDFMCICPEINLIDKSGGFCGIPNTTVCNNCLPHNKSEVLRYLIQPDMEEWRQRWGEFLSECDQILCFSNSTISLIQKAYPSLDPGKFRYQPHTVIYLPDYKPVVDLGWNLHIGVVGSIMHNKGARVIEQMSRQISENNLPVRLTVIGTIISDSDLPGVEVTGSFQRNELPGLLERYGINICFFPSIWPETFSYVTEELMLLDMPLAVFNIGAPPERVSLYNKGLIIDEVGDASAALEKIIAFYNKLKSGHAPGYQQGKNKVGA